MKLFRTFKFDYRWSCPRCGLQPDLEAPLPTDQSLTPKLNQCLLNRERSMSQTLQSCIRCVQGTLLDELICHPLPWGILGILVLLQTATEIRGIRFKTSNHYNRIMAIGHSLREDHIIIGYLEVRSSQAAKCDMLSGPNVFIKYESFP